MPDESTKRPRVAVIMGEEHWRAQFTPELRRRLGEAANLTAPVQVNSLSDPALAGQLADIEFLITGWGAMPLSSDALDKMPRLRGLLHSAGSVRGLVTSDFWERGITVSTSADLNADPVAEFTLASIIMAGKKAPFLAAELRAEAAKDPRSAVGPGCMGNARRTIGIVGFSRIGRRVLHLVSQTLHETTCLVMDPFADRREVAEAGAHLVSMEEMLARADILTLHAPLLPSTRHMIGPRELALLSDGVTIINTARGALIDEEALEGELVSGRLSAILDVTEPEPLPPTSPLYGLTNVFITPHIAGALGTETQRMASAALDELERLSSDQPLERELTRQQYEVSA
ncbi:D-3-phosphoglycerate dehydrogenase [Microbacterium azadirachtae]|uniref:D-3-phosphoglycerate dehydrogenase n=1 Tax=Microbacterium azadirachtae TaxID=582680 RepID=A0A0F0KYE1_9MICO|nr:hydroxyacid dehydrogenase [Microbacterium azadirachtae]KJL24261.1 D-3-phosphoglycerate dehydrogenase [Microbacterium azadirachtae]